MFTRRRGDSPTNARGRGQTSYMLLGEGDFGSEKRESDRCSDAGGAPAALAIPYPFAQAQDAAYRFAANARANAAAMTP